MKATSNKSLESWKWDAACSIWRQKNAPKYKDSTLPFIFTKLCDVFDDKLNRIAKKASYDANELERFPARAGFPGKSSANSGWVKHMHASLGDQRAEYRKEIVHALSAQLGSPHFRSLLPFKALLQRDFYAEMYRVERWNTRTAAKEIDSMLFPRTAISKNPEKAPKPSSIPPDQILVKPTKDSVTSSKRWESDHEEYRSCIRSGRPVRRSLEEAGGQTNLRGPAGDSGEDQDMSLAESRVANCELTETSDRGHLDELCHKMTQDKIAHILSTVQEAVEAQKRIKQTTEQKKILTHNLFTEGLPVRNPGEGRHQRNEPQKQTEIGPVPESWEVVEMESTGEVVYGIKGSAGNNLATVGTRILTNKNITLDGGFDFEKINYFELTSKRHQATILQHSDILFNWRRGSKYHVGRIAYFDLEVELGHSSFILRTQPNTEINGRFFYYYFNLLREEEYFVKLQITAKFKESAINALPTVTPSREEQDEIASIPDTAQKKIDSANNRRSKTNSARLHTN